MTHYERRLEQDLEHIRSRVAAVAEAVRHALAESVDGLLAFDRPRLYGVVLGDHPINREIRAIDKLCHTFVARHLPAAGHLRFVSSVLRLTIALERIGDYAVTIGRVSVKMSRPVPESVADDIRSLADSTLRMLERANAAYVNGNVERARETRKLADKVDRVHNKAFVAMIEDEGYSHIELVSVLTVFGRLERASDQAKNICEETLFAVLGETKPPKQYPVLFVDRTNALHSPLAQALANKAYPKSGRYASAGWEAAEALDENLARLGDRLGLELQHAPVALRPLRSDPAEYHVIVVINGGGEAPIGSIPFHTAVQEWDVDPEPSGQAALELLTRDLSGRIADLMELLSGEHAG